MRWVAGWSIFAHLLVVLCQFMNLYHQLFIPDLIDDIWEEFDFRIVYLW